jgi:hypothetical protein
VCAWRLEGWPTDKKRVGKLELLTVACDLPGRMDSAHDPACLFGRVERKSVCNVDNSRFLPEVMISGTDAPTVLRYCRKYHHRDICRPPRLPYSSYCMHRTTLYGGTWLHLWAILTRGPARLLFTPQSYTNLSLAPDIVIANAQWDRHGFLQTIIAFSDIYAVTDHSQLLISHSVSINNLLR